MDRTEDDALPISTPTSSSVQSSSGNSRKDNSSDSGGFFGRGRYKIWALAAILLLAFWSMLTGTVTLRWSAGNLNRFHDDYHSPAAEDLDVLDMEEREKLVKHMWDVYTNSPRIRLAGFWQEAFVAAYEDLKSEVPQVREAAISEIVKMSSRYIKLDPPLLHSHLRLCSNIWFTHTAVGFRVLDGEGGKFTWLWHNEYMLNQNIRDLNIKQVKHRGNDLKRE